MKLELTDLDFLLMDGDEFSFLGEALRDDLGSDVGLKERTPVPQISNSHHQIILLIPLANYCILTKN